MNPHQNNPHATRQTIGYFIGFFTLGSVIASLGVTLPGLAEHLSAGLDDMGLLFTFRSFGYLLGSLLCGWLIDRFTGHRVIVVYFILAAIILALIPQISTLILTMLGFFIVGITQSGIDVGTNTMLPRVHGDRSAPYLNALFFFAGLGGFVTPIVLQRIQTTDFGLTGAYLVIAVLAIPPAIWLAFTPTPAEEGENGSEDEGQFKTVPFMLVLMLAFIFIGSEVSFSGWIYTYVFEGGIGSAETAALITSSFFITLTIGRLVAIPVTAKIQPINVILICILGTLVSLGILLLPPHTQTMTWVGATLFGFFTAAVFPTTYSYIKKHIRISGRLAGWIWASGSTGAMLIPWLIGIAIARSGIVSMIVILIAFWLLAAVVYAGFRYSTSRGRPM